MNINNSSLPFAPLFHTQAPRKPGRPVGSKAAVIQDPRALGIHHFAFVRSSLLGLDLREAFTRYLAWSETTTDLRYIQNRREALLKRIIEAGRHLDASLPESGKITDLLEQSNRFTFLQRKVNLLLICLKSAVFIGKVSPGKVTHLLSLTCVV